MNKAILSIIGFVVIIAAIYSDKPALAGVIFHKRQFDLICKVKGGIISDPHPSYVGLFPGTRWKWRDTERYIVNLNAMQYCETRGCQGATDPERILSVTSRRIVFYDKSWLKWSVRRSDGWSRDWLKDGEEVSLTTGFCRMAKFSGIPARKPSSGLAPPVNPR